MAVSIVRLGTDRQHGEGLRIGTVRRPPRGVPKAQSAWRAFERRFSAELKTPDASHLLDTLAALSHAASFSVGCYCEDERSCHRSILRRELERRGAHIRSTPC